MKPQTHILLLLPLPGSHCSSFYSFPFFASSSSTSTQVPGGNTRKAIERFKLKELRRKFGNLMSWGNLMSRFTCTLITCPPGLLPYLLLIGETLSVQAKAVETFREMLRYTQIINFESSPAPPEHDSEMGPPVGAVASFQRNFASCVGPEGTSFGGTLVTHL